MNDVIEAMLNRRSIRKYKAEMPPKEMIDEIVKAGLYAASGMGPVSYTHLDVYKRQVQCFVILS